MYTGGENYSKRSAMIIRYAGFIVPIFLVLYGLLVKGELFPSPVPFNDVSYLAFSFWWVCLGTLQFLIPSRTKTDSLLRLICYHLLAAAYLVFIAGVSSPLVIFWIFLLIASHIYFSQTGLNASVAWFSIVVLADAAYWARYDLSVVAYDFLTLAVVALSGLVLMSLSRTQAVSSLLLKKTKAGESFQKDRVVTIMNNLSDPIVSTDGHGVIKLYNAATLGMLDTNASIQGKIIDDVLRLTDASGAPVPLLPLLENARNTIVRDDLIYTLSADDNMRLEVKLSPIRSSYSGTRHRETHDGYIIMLRDITKSKSLEEERDEFISVVSHELRTPITVAEGAVSNVQAMMSHKDVSPKMLRDSIDMAHNEIVFLSKMVNDLSTLSRAERGVADTVEQIDLRELGHKMHDTYHDDAKKRGLRLDIDLGSNLGSVQASRLYLEEILQNFITNSIKYTQKGSITLTIKQRANIATFAVSDTGIGISKTDQDKVFNKFYRSEDYRTRETNGTGLGLYITAKLARKLGTHIELVSRLNHGSTFSFKLPVIEK